MDPRAYGDRRSPPVINTSNIGTMPQGRGGRRFSYAETPIDMQEPVFGRAQNYSHNQDTLDEASTPIEAGGLDGYHIQASTSPVASAYNVPQPSNLFATPQQATPAQRTSSPYGFPEPQGVHPAYYAPVASQIPQNDTSQSLEPVPTPYLTHPQNPPQRNPQRSSTIPIHSETDTRQQPIRSPTKSSSPIQPDHVQIPYTPRSLTSPTQPIFAPGALTGPNGMAPEMHQPGQVAHPNMQNVTGSTSDKSPFLHSLCECNADVVTCLEGLFCPCILDSRTAYRMGRRAEKKDPTDMLGFKSCNGRCAVMGLFGICGFYCKLRHRSFYIGSTADG
jgi:hypothetical protein